MNKILAYFAIMAAVALIISAVVRWISRITPRRKSSVAALAAPPTRKFEDRAMLGALFKGWGSLAFALVVFLVMFRPFVALSDSEVFSIALNAGLSASAGLLFFSALPAAQSGSKIRSESSSTLSAVRVNVGWKRYGILFFVTAAYLALLVIAGSASSPDPSGKFRLLTVTAAGNSAEASPFVGWHYGVPLLVLAVLTFSCTVLALQRISRTAALPDLRMRGLDVAWRQLSLGITWSLGTGIMLAFFGASSAISGAAMSNVALSLADPAAHPQQPLFALGVAAGLLGLALAIAGVVLLVLGLKTALTLPTSSRKLAAKIQTLHA